MTALGDGELVGDELLQELLDIDDVHVLDTPDEIDLFAEGEDELVDVLQQ
jgi:hypothetical protein